MASPVVAHAGPATGGHVVVDSLLGIGIGGVVVGIYYLYLRHVVDSEQMQD